MSTHTTTPTCHAATTKCMHPKLHTTYLWWCLSVQCMRCVWWWNRCKPDFVYRIEVQHYLGQAWFALKITAKYVQVVRPVRLENVFRTFEYIVNCCIVVCTVVIIMIIMWSCVSNYLHHRRLWNAVVYGSNADIQIYIYIYVFVRWD